MPPNRHSKPQSWAVSGIKDELFTKSHRFRPCGYYRRRSLLFLCRCGGKLIIAPGLRRNRYRRVVEPVLLIRTVVKRSK